MSGDILWLSQLGDCYWYLGMLLNSLQCTGSPSNKGLFSPKCQSCWVWEPPALIHARIFSLPDYHSSLWTDLPLPSPEAMQIQLQYPSQLLITVRVKTTLPQDGLDGPAEFCPWPVLQRPFLLLLACSLFSSCIGFFLIFVWVLLFLPLAFIYTSLPGTLSFQPISC